MAEIITVKAKKNINGPVLGVNFVDGVATNPHPAALAFFAANGDYSVEDGGKPKPRSGDASA